MSHPIITPHPAFVFPKPDCPQMQNFKLSDNIDFSAGSSDTGFEHSKSGTGKSHTLTRFRPRLVKSRRKQVASEDVGSVKTDLGSNGFSDVTHQIKLDGKLGNFAGSNDRNPMSNGCVKDGDLSGHKGQVGNWSDFGVNSNGSLFVSGMGNGKSLFDSSVNGSTSNVQSKDAHFLFASSTGANQTLPDLNYVFGPSKSVFPMDKNMESLQFVFGASDCSAKDSRGFKTRSKDHGFKKSDNIEFHKVNSAKFASSAIKDISIAINSDTQKQDSGQNMDKCESSYYNGSKLSVVTGEVKLETSGDSEKVSNSSSFQFPFSHSDDSRKNHLNFVFGSNSNDSKVGIDSDRPTGTNKFMSNSKDCGKENVDIGIQFPNVCLGGVFVFGGLKDRNGFNSDGNTKLVNEMNHLNRVKAEDCNGFVHHNYNTPDSTNGGFSDKGPALGLSDEIKKLNIISSKIDIKKNVTSIVSVNSDNNVFVFGRDQKNSGLENENKDNICFASKAFGLDSSDADCCTPNTTFAFSKHDNAYSKSLGGKRSKKISGKLKQRTVVQQLFGQDRVSEDRSSMQNNKSPGCGSPMDFSPYQDTNGCNNNNGVKVESFTNEKDTSENGVESDDEKNSNFSTSLPVQDSLSVLRRQYKKKYKLRVGSNCTVQGNNSDKGHTKQDEVPTTAHELCESWRIRGNQAYHDGELSKAEEFYSTGIGFAPGVSNLGYSIKSLLLCYSNRAATRMSLGRMREAIGDCTEASELDPNFLKVTLRAGNCYLVLGEVVDAIKCYSKCLSSGTDVCLDRRITVEAADGLQKANRVAEYMHQSAKLLQEVTESSASSALKNIDEALSISRFSERLLQMKGEALCSLRMYDEAIKLCERTLDISKKNFGDANVKLWRWHIQAKSQFHLGRLDLALDFIEKQESMPVGSRFGDMTQEPSNALAATVRELLSLKKSGNEAFNSGRHKEAIENYTSAISKSFDSRPFMSICFCNRAAAYQSINQIVDAIADCSLAIALDENYQKAISRRATLHEMIRDYKQAACDLERLISLLESQPRTKSQQSGGQSKSDGGSARDIRKARRRLSSLEDKAKKEVTMDLYLILGIKSSDTESEIKKAYRKAALRHHPDKVLVRSDVGDYATLWKDFGGKIHNDADRLFKIIGEAYTVLSDPSKRSEYDNEEEIRKLYRNSNSGCSYNSPYERGNWFGREASSSTSSERNNRRYYWSESRTYSNSHSRW